MRDIVKNDDLDPEFWMICPLELTACKHVVVEEYGVYCDLITEYLKTDMEGCGA